MNNPFGLLEESPHEALILLDPNTGRAASNRACMDRYYLPGESTIRDMIGLLTGEEETRSGLLALVDNGGKDGGRYSVYPEGAHCRVLVHRDAGSGRVLLHLRDERELDRVKSQLSEYAEALITNFYDLEVANRSIGSVETEKSSIVHAAIEVVAMTLEMSDRYTYGHSKRVSALACRIAEAGGLTSRETEELRRAALLHDIGKLGVISDILRKPAPLDRTERQIVENHPRYGYDLLSNLPDFDGIAEVVYAHHENWDGSGYPRGLSGMDIPLAATVISCADTFDAICTNRPYRPAHGIEFAYRELQACRGTQFNPEVVDWFLTIPKDDFIRIEAQWQMD